MRLFEFTASPEEVLSNPTRTLQLFSMRLTEYRMNLKDQCTGTVITAPGGFRGEVKAVSHDHVIAKSSMDGTERKLALNASRMRQLFPEATTRK